MADQATSMRKRGGGLGRFSLPDWAFLPVAAAVFAGLIMLAMTYRPTGQDPIVTDTQYLMTGPALGQLVPGPGTSVQLVTGAMEPLARMRASASLEAAGRLSAGVAAIIPPEFEAAVIGRLLKVEAELRAEPGSELTEARLGYFTTGGGDSGWRPVPVSEEFRTVGFCWRVRPDAPTNGVESVGVWPDVEGADRVLLVRELRVTIQPEAIDQATCEASLAAR
ncbi:MAG: hypothetical protein ABL308_10250 [Oceanicaulis sp.]